MGLVNIVPLVETVSFGLWSLMPMGAHKSKTIKHLTKVEKESQQLTLNTLEILNLKPLLLIETH